MRSLNSFIDNYIITENRVNLSLLDIKKITKTNNYKFNTIILLACNEENPKDNMDDLLSALCDKNNLKYYYLNIKYIDYKKHNNKFIITCKNKTITLTDADKSSTVIFTRYPLRQYENAVNLSNDLYRSNFIVLNPECKTSISADKYETYKIFKKHDIQQSRTLLVTKKDIEKNNFDINKFLEDIYPEIKTNSENQNEKLQYVIKIPGGAGGIGVFKCEHNDILGILQGIFAIKENQQLLIQRFEKAKEGDIRIHVITYNDKQQIIGAIERVKSNKDFRTNYFEKVKLVELTTEQQELALKTAKASGLIWCGIDLMPIEKNIDGYENVVIEYNSSSGVSGICQAMKTNFANVILDTLSSLK